MVHLGVTLFIGGVFGFLFFKLRVPGGMMVGALPVSYTHLTLPTIA